jgi:hypothetical protein
MQGLLDNEEISENPRRKMKYVLCIVFLFTLSTAVAAQELNKRNFTKQLGTVSGEIVIKEAVGSGLTKFKCSNLIARAGKLGGGWNVSSRARGDFTKRRCTFTLPPMPAGIQFLAFLDAEMPGCDQKTFDTTTSFPMELKPGEAMKYNFSVIKISCVLLK